MDREKVIKGLECCSAMSGDECRECPYGHECLDNDLPYGMPHLAADALSLLKEQEADRKFYVEKCDDLYSLAKSRTEVVRCKNCTYRGEINCPQYYRRTELSDNYFCADGERSPDDG